MTRNCSPLVKTNHYDAKRKRPRSNRNSWSQLITASNQAKARQGRVRHLYATLALSDYSRQQAQGTSTVLGETTESRMEIVAVKVMPVFDTSLSEACMDRTRQTSHCTGRESTQQTNQVPVPRADSRIQRGLMAFSFGTAMGCVKTLGAHHVHERTVPVDLPIRPLEPHGCPTLVPRNSGDLASFRGPRADWRKGKRNPTVRKRKPCLSSSLWYCILVWFDRLGIGPTDAQAGLVQYGTSVDVNS